jgi:hypothetical protein
MNQVPIAPAVEPDSNLGELDHGISINDAVLVHMITNTDAEHSVFFIEPTGSIQDLSPRWGSQYEVYPIWDAEWEDFIVPFWPKIGYDLPRPGPEIQKRRLVLRWTNKGGVIIHVRIEWVQGDDAEASASYDWGGLGSGATYAYSLKRVGHEWRVISASAPVFP